MGDDEDNEKRRLVLWLLVPFGVALLAYVLCRNMEHVWPGVVVGFVMSLNSILLTRPWRKP